MITKRVFAVFVATLTFQTFSGAQLPGTPRPGPSAATQDLEKIISAIDNGVNTDAVILFKDGQKIYEKYARGYTPQTKHLSWSMAKTVSGILIGQAIKEHRLTLDQNAQTILPAAKSGASILNFLNMSSGIQFKEEYSGVPVNSDTTKMLYLEGPHRGFSAYVLDLPNRISAESTAHAELAPGAHFYYSSGDTLVLMEALRKVTTKTEYDEFPWRGLFNPLGITDATFEQDNAGTFVGASYVYLTAPDYLKLGQLLAQRGVWNGMQIIPPHYFNLMNTVAPGVNQIALPGTSQNRAYAAQVTTNQPIPGRYQPSLFADLPADALLLIGHQGQYVIASPSQNLVIVRLGFDGGPGLDLRGFLRAVKNLILERGLSYQTVGDINPGIPPSTPTGAPVEKATQKRDVTDYAKVPHLMRAVAAKDLCSCLFVVKRSEADCKTDLKVTLPSFPKINIDSVNKTVRASDMTGLAGKASIAEFKSDRLGCTLTVSK